MKASLHGTILLRDKSPCFESNNSSPLTAGTRHRLTGTFSLLFRRDKGYHSFAGSHQPPALLNKEMIPSSVITFENEVVKKSYIVAIISTAGSPVKGKAEKN